MPNCSELTFEVLRVVSFGYCPLRELSFRSVVTAVPAPGLELRL